MSTTKLTKRLVFLFNINVRILWFLICTGKIKMIKKLIIILSITILLCSCNNEPRFKTYKISPNHSFLLLDTETGAIFYVVNVFNFPGIKTLISAAKDNLLDGYNGKYYLTKRSDFNYLLVDSNKGNLYNCIIAIGVNPYENCKPD